MVSTAPSEPWERAVMSLVDENGPVAVAPPIVDCPDLLDRAYARCRAITARYSRSFYLATRLLPPEKRRAMHALYAFCRTTDDIVDCGAGDARQTLMQWRHTVRRQQPPPSDPVATAWADTRARFRIPLRYGEELIDGIALDLQPVRYRTFADLADYAARVASTVGLMSMHIVGFSDPDAIPCALKLGLAMQITNILRDVGEDWRLGRVYLPADELAAFSLGEADLSRGRVDDRWRAFMRFQIARNRRLYAAAWPGIALFSRDGRLAVTAAGTFYRAILCDIERHDYEVFQRRAHVTTWAKLRLLPSVWWQMPGR